MKNILCFGDSNTWGFDIENYDFTTGTAKRMPFDTRWTGIMQEKLGCDYRVIENALNARTCMQDDPYSPHRLGLSSLEETLDANAPLDLVIIILGVNELKHMFNLTSGMIVYGAEKLVKAAQVSYYGYPIPKILLIAPPPVSEKISEGIFGFSFGTQAYAKSLEFSELYHNLADRYDCGFIDCADLNFELNEVDGLHYSRKDHAKLAEAATETVLKMLPES